MEPAPGLTGAVGRADRRRPPAGSEDTVDDR